jgi:hypothetical protein
VTRIPDGKTHPGEVQRRRKEQRRQGFVDLQQMNIEKENMGKCERGREKSYRSKETCPSYKYSTVQSFM